jgi:hypothetical protein
VAEFAARVACWLPGWRFDALEREGFRLPQLIGEHGARLEFRDAWNRKNMIRVAGLGAGYRSPSINVSATREPRAAAADIGRRLIPDYLTAYAAERERKAAEAEKAEAYTQLIHCFERIGMEHRHSHGRGSSAFMVGKNCTATLHGLDRVEFSAHIDPAQAMRLVAFLDSLYRDEPQ